MFKTPTSENASVAVIDLGSNSIKLLVAAPGNGGQPLAVVDSKTLETRISEGISKAVPRLSEAAFEAGLESVVELHRRALNREPKHIALVATSMVRDAQNGPEFIAAIKQKTGLDCSILSGTEEAEGIAHGIACDPACMDWRSFDLMDIGGGSFEFISFQNLQPQSMVSLQLGAVRMLELCTDNASAPLSPESIEYVHQHSLQTLSTSGFSFTQGAQLIATGGAFSVARAILAGEAGNTVEASAATLTRGDLLDLAHRLAKMPLAERVQLPFLPPKRADILPVALFTINAAMEYAGVERCVHSFYNLRFGIAAKLLKSLNSASPASSVEKI